MMRIVITAETNCPTPYVNTAQFMTKYGELIIDRDRTEWSYNEADNIMTMEWIGCYIWDGETENYDIPAGAFDTAVLNSIEIEDDAPEDIVFKVKTVLVSGREVPILFQ